MTETEPRLVMIIGDDPAQSRLITAVAARDGWRTIIADSGANAMAILGARQGTRLAAIILDQRQPGDQVCERIAGALIAELRSRRAALPILMLTAAASPLQAVAAMRAGASDYLVKPVAPDRLMAALRAATTRSAPRDDLQPLSEKLTANPRFDAMVGASPGFRNALAIAAKAARGAGAVLIEGECGTGKEMLARAIHAASLRNKLPLRLVNLGTTPPSAIESVLFGHEQGAFPGAFDRQPGAFRSSEGGTLLLDEVDRLPEPAQHRLLHALTRRECRPVGARHSFRLDVRTIFAADVALADLVCNGQFLPELLAAMSPVTLTLPPLRERSSDIAALSRHFLARIAEQPGLRALGITDAALEVLTAYDWPGNVRQLQAVLFRAAVFCDGEALTAEDFPQLAELVGHGHGHGSGHRQENASITLFAPDGNLRLLEDIEGDVIRLAIGHYHGCMSEVARRLGIGRSTLYRKLTDLGIDHAA